MSSVVRNFGKRYAKRAARRVGSWISGKAVSLLKEIVPKNPPTLDISPRITRTYRYVATTAGTNLVGCTAGEIFGALGCTTTTVNSSVTCWFTSFRIHSLCIFIPGGSTASVIWVGPLIGIGPDTEADSSVLTSITTPNCIKSKPPVWSMASDWINTGTTLTTNIFVLSVPAGALVDLHISATLSNSFGPTSRTVASASPLGAPFYLALDGVTSNNLRPVGLPTTA